MKTVIIVNDLTESDVIKKDIYKEYVNRLQNDIQAKLIKQNNLTDVNWFGADTSQISVEYDCLGMQYKRCPHTGSLFISPRPDAQSLREFTAESEACRFWRSKMLNLDDKDVYYIYGSRVNWITELVDEHLPEAANMLDINTKYPFLLSHLNGENVFKKMYSFQPELFERSDLMPEFVNEINDLKEAEGDIDVLTAFESLERMADPSVLFQTASKVCKPGGLFLLTAATCSGFEYQVLGEKAPNLNPINRMNLLTLEFIRSEIEQAGFELVELSTPGRLDIEIVRKVYESDPEVKLDPFWKYIFDHRDEAMRKNFQQFLQENRLSSHVRIAAKKKT